MNSCINLNFRISRENEKWFLGVGNYAAFGADDKLLWKLVIILCFFLEQPLLCFELADHLCGILFTFWSDHVLISYFFSVFCTYLYTFMLGLKCPQRVGGVRS